jgi:hypothetical protein
MKHFYTHLIDIESIIVELDKLDLNDKQKVQLTTLIDSTLHHHILDTVLSELSDEDKHIFLEHVSKQEHDKIWGLLNNKVDKIEDKIKEAADELKKEIHQDIKEAKEKN